MADILVSFGIGFAASLLAAYVYDRLFHRDS